MANVFITYILWLFFGWLGIHHLYLGQANQAIVWFATFGGGLGVGWIRDFWRIPDYIKWCNGDSIYLKEYQESIAKRPRPSCSYFRLVGMFVMGILTASILCILVPDFEGMMKTYPSYYYFCVMTYNALAISGNVIGVLLVANIGKLACEKYFPCFGALVTFFWAYDQIVSIKAVALTTVAFTWLFGLNWRPVEDKRRASEETLKNVTKYIAACSVLLLILTYGVLFKATIMDINGKQIPVRVAVTNFFKSFDWQNTNKFHYQSYKNENKDDQSRRNEYEKRDFSSAGKFNLYKELDLPPGAKPDEISRKCRKLMGKYHPDQFRTQEEKEAAQNIFVEITKACSALQNRARFN